jgi:cytochrome P450
MRNEATFASFVRTITQRNTAVNDTMTLKTDGLEPPVSDLDPFSMEFLSEPYYFYEELRELGPIVRSSKYGTYMASRYEDVVAIEKDWQSFTNRFGTGLSDIRQPGSWRKPGPFAEVDPPDHTQVRSVMMKIISPIVVRGWRENFEREGRALMEKLVQQGDIDGVKDVAEAIVLSVFPDAMGVEINRDQAIAVGNLNFNSLGPQNELFLAAKAEVEPFLAWWQKALTRDAMIPGGFGEQIFQAEERGDLKPGTAPGLIMTFLRGGMDTTVSAIGSALWLLASHPDQWALLRKSPERVRELFDETLRFESPIQSHFRTTTRDMVFAGIRLEHDVKVQVLLASANRDPRKWPHADEFDITRSAAGHVALSAGIHQCIGQMIARIEFESVIAPLLKQVKKLELTGKPVRRFNNALRTLQTLPLRLVAA